MPLTTPGWWPTTLALAVGSGLIGFPGLMTSFLGFTTFSLGGLGGGFAPGVFLLGIFTASLVVSSLVSCKHGHSGYVRTLGNIGLWVLHVDYSYERVCLACVPSRYVQNINTRHAISLLIMSQCVQRKHIHTV